MKADDSFREQRGHVAASNNPCKQTVFCPWSIRSGEEHHEHERADGDETRRARRRECGALRARVLDLDVKSHFASRDCVSLRR